MKEIRLPLPKGWNALSTEQMEAVSDILINHARNYTATGQYNEVKMLTECFFLLSGLRITSLPSFDTDRPDDPWYECEYADEQLRKRFQRQSDGSITPIRIYVSEIYAIAVGTIPAEEIKDYVSALATYEQSDHKGDPPKYPQPKGPLSWLIQPCDRTIFPYPTLSLYVDSSTSSSPVTFYGPNPLMDGMTWRQYRFLGDYMSLLAKVENSLLQLQKQNKDTRQMQQTVNRVRSEFLATLFVRSVKHLSPETGFEETSPYFVSSQPQDNSTYFSNFPDNKFQCISLWWQGMMLYLSHQYPKVFRRSATGKSSNDDALKLYTRSIATLIKYSGGSEEEINRRSYTIILQQMQDMADENESIKEMRSKSKKK